MCDRASCRVCKAYVNQKIPYEKFALFEMNKVYQKKWGMNAEGVPVEKSQLGCVIAERKNSGTAYYKAKRFVERLMAELNVKVTFAPLSGSEAMAEPFEPKRAATIMVEGGESLGVVGEFKNSVRNDFKLAEFLAGFEIDLDALLGKMGEKKEIYLGEIEKRDLTVTTKDTYAELLAKIEVILAKYKLKAKISPLGIYQPKGQKAKNISVHLEFEGKVTAKVMAELEKI